MSDTTMWCWAEATNRLCRRLPSDDGARAVAVGSALCEAYRAGLKAGHADLLAALNVLLGSYVELANCGDCGSWDPEEEPMVIAARAAIAKATTP